MGSSAYTFRRGFVHSWVAHARGKGVGGTSMSNASNAIRPARSFASGSLVGAQELGRTNPRSMATLTASVRRLTCNLYRMLLT